MNILAIDPGPTESAYLAYDGEKPYGMDILSNEEMVRKILDYYHCEHMAIEGVACYGMAVGKEVFDTCIWIGRFIQQWSPLKPCDWSLVYRPEVKLHLCHSARAKDPNVRQALLDKFGGKEKAIGKKATPGPLYGVRSHVWSALAVAVTYYETKILTPVS